MKLVIELTDKMHQAVKDATWCGNELWYNALKNGIPLEEVLEDIKAEIDNLPSYLTEDGRRIVRKCRVHKIIDSHISGKE